MSGLPFLAFLLLLAGCASHPAVPGAPSAGVGSVERRLGIMGTTLEVHIEAAGRQPAVAASERAVAALEAAEARLSTWRQDTELARLNRAPAGEPFPLSPALAAELGAARRCWQETGGAFDPTVGPLVRAWGLREGGRKPEPGELERAVAATGMAGLRLAGGAAVRERQGLVLEEGGFGKGAGLADALRTLAGDPAVVSARLDVGGQVAVFSRTEREWVVPVADPGARQRPAVALRVESGSVATSGNSERGIVVEGERLGHLLDPRTGRPAPDFGSLTVWTADPLRADCLSTGLYVLGPEDALERAARSPGTEVLVLRPRGERTEALASAGLKGRLEVLADDVDLKFWTVEKNPGLDGGESEGTRAVGYGGETVSAHRPLRTRAARQRRADPRETIHAFHRFRGIPPV